MIEMARNYHKYGPESNSPTKYEKTNNNIHKQKTKVQTRKTFLISLGETNLYLHLFKLIMSP